MKEKIPYIQLVAMIGMIFLIINLSSNINNLNNSYNNLQSQIIGINNQVSSIDNNMYNLVQNKKSVKKYDYFIDNVNEDFSKAVVAVELEFNTIRKNAKVYYLYRTTSLSEDILSLNGFETQDKKPEDIYGEWIETELVMSSQGSYKGELELNYSNNYECKVIIETTDEIISEELSDLPLYDKSKPMYDIDFSLREVNSTGKFNYQLSLGTDNEFNEIEIVSAYCTIYYNENKIDEFELIADEYLMDKDEYKYWSVIKEDIVEEIDMENFEKELTAIIRVTDGLGREFIHKTMR